MQQVERQFRKMQLYGINLEECDLVINCHSFVSFAYHHGLIYFAISFPCF